MRVRDVFSYHNRQVHMEGFPTLSSCAHTAKIIDSIHNLVKIGLFILASWQGVGEPRKATIALCQIAKSGSYQRVFAVFQTEFGNPGQQFGRLSCSPTGC